MVKELLNKIRKRSFKPFLSKIDEINEAIRELADASFKTRAMLKQEMNRPINVLFVCHEPSLWNMFESVYRAMECDANFLPLVVALPYKHGTIIGQEYKDAGMFNFCRHSKINAVIGYDDKTRNVLIPGSLLPDYVFFQTPYNVYPSGWSASEISLIARICYIPYGGCIYAGEVDEVVNPKDFFTHVSMVFKENLYTHKIFVERFKEFSWFRRISVYASGCPKLDFLYEDGNYAGNLWRRRLQKNVKRILWTPRWHTSEGNCHFFDYKQFFIDFCNNHVNVDFIFRPHPLCLQNFLKTGELSTSELELMEYAYHNSFNMVIDKGGGYEDTFMTSDILISDMSTILFDYFATGKPIIYTHRVDHFNELGKCLSDGFYWVKNSIELYNTLQMLISGHDPLKAKREEIKKNHLLFVDGGSGRFIKEKIMDDFRVIGN